MTTRSERDRAKAQQEKFQAILSSLLKDEDNKYCEDCDAKAPRWASWNLGVFLCIRCAGIHRNLGVHISRVKSVNLDSWTAEQVAMMQEMGNSRARAVYEANVQDSFRRPQTESALEAFIRAKYEQKKYIAKEWVPPKPVIPKEWLEDDKAEKKKIRNKPTSNITLTNIPQSSQSSSSSSGSSEARAGARAATSAPAEAKPTQPPAAKPKASSDDLLGLESEVPQQSGGGGGGGQGGDLLADIFGGSQASASAQGGASQQNLMTTQQNGSAEPNLFESGNGEGQQGEKKSAKDSIMALYGSGGGQQQMFGSQVCYYFGQYTVARSDMTSNGDMMASNTGVVPSHFALGASSSTGVPPTFSSCHGVSSAGIMTSNAGMAYPFSGTDPGMGFPGMMTSNSGMMAPPNPAVFSEMMMNPNSVSMSNSNFKSQTPSVFSGNMGTGMNTAPSIASKSAIFSASSGINLQQKSFQSLGSNDTVKIAQSMGLKTASAGMSSSTKSVASHMGVMPSAKPQGAGALSPTMANNPFLYPTGEFYQAYSPNMYYYPTAGGMYMPQQQMYPGGGGMQPMVQPQAAMMGMPQQGMMGQPLQQGMMGMQQHQQQQPGAMFGGGGQMGQNQMGGSMMGGAQGGMMGRPGGQMFMQQQQPQQQQQQQMNPMQQQMQFQQMQQQMANMSMGGGSQMGGMQAAPQQAAVGGGSWGAAGTGQTLSNNLWQ